MKSIYILLIACVSFFVVSCGDSKNVISFAEFGDKVDSNFNSSIAAGKLIEYLNSRKDTRLLTINFPKGTYHFYGDSAFAREYYISNHDQVNPKRVAFALENVKNLIIDGNGSEFVFHGRMIPIALINSENVTIKNLSIDFEIPALRQLNILQVNKEKNEIIAEIYPHGHYKIRHDSLVIVGEEYEYKPFISMPFSADKRLTYKRSDVDFNPKIVKEITQDTLLLKDWNQAQETKPGERFVLRTYYRPTPGIFLSENKNTTLQNINLHYAEGMGLIAQLCENIVLDSFNVCFRGENDMRFFTTQADATHFSGCKGLIISQNSLYEAMADDAINVHGTYLLILKRLNDSTLQAEYMHEQAWGFKWAEPGDTVQFVESDKMETLGNQPNIIKSIQAIDKPTEFGAKEFQIVFAKELPKEISGSGKYGVENLTWTPTVIFSNNIVRNNRARGSLFSTPKKVVCANNLFDHTHGSAILLCGDCNGWFESGACKDVIIKNNKFVNALTANYQFTNAIISIYPEIPDLLSQQKYFHSGIIIENNTFDMFESPVLYAKSTNGLIFRNNTFTYNNEFESYHWNKYLFFFEKVDNVVLERNNFGRSLDADKDIKNNLSSPGSVTVR